MLRRHLKCTPWLVLFRVGRGLWARWEWRWWIASHCAVYGVRDWLWTHRIHGQAPNNFKQHPTLEDAPLTLWKSTELLEFPHLFIFSGWNRSLLLASLPGADSSWYPVYQREACIETPRQNLQPTQTIEDAARSFLLTRFFFSTNKQMAPDRYFGSPVAES